MTVRLILALLSCCALRGQQVASKYGITAQYGADFSGASWTLEPRLTQQEIGTDIPEGVAPARAALHLKGRLPGRADENTIEIVPLKDGSAPDFGRAYPGLNSAALALRSLLGKPAVPGMKALQRADYAAVDAAYSLCARVERLESGWVRGFGFLAQFTQEESGDLPNNRELTWQFLGATRDGAYLIHGAFAVNHASLSSDSVYVEARKLRESERRLAGLEEDTFEPPLSRLKAIIRSLARAQ